MVPEEGKREMRFDPLEIGMDRWVARSVYRLIHSYLPWELPIEMDKWIAKCHRSLKDAS